MEKYDFTVLVNEAQVPVTCDIDENGQPHNMKSPDDGGEKVFNNFKGLLLKVRRSDKQGYEREHDARMCASRVSSNGNADFRIEFSDLYLSFYEICRAVAFISYQNGTGVPLSYQNDEVIAYAVSNYT